MRVRPSMKKLRCRLRRKKETLASDKENVKFREGEAGKEDIKV